MDDLVFFRATRLNSQVTRIKGISDELMYLVEGSRQAALIDTGVGVGNLKDFVGQLTDKPLIVLITHAHVDHAMGASLFQDVYMNPADEVIYRDHRRVEKRQVYLKRFLGKKYDQLHEQDFINAPVMNFHALQEGDVFDLGGLTLEIFAAPGHSPGSVVILLREERALLLGDACNTLTLLFDEHSPSIEEFRDELLQLREKTRGRYDRVYISHGPGDASPDMIDSLISVCEDILQGRSDEIPFRFLEYHLVSAKRISAALIRSDGGTGNIVYNKNNVFRSDHKA